MKESNVDDVMYGLETLESYQAECVECSTTQESEDKGKRSFAKHLLECGWELADEDDWYTGALLCPDCAKKGDS